MRLMGKLVSLVNRRALRAEGHVFAVTPERIAIAEGLQALVAMAPMLCAAVLLGRPEMAFGAVAAFWTCLSDPQGPTAGRLRAMGLFIALGVVVLPIAAYAAHFGFVPSVAALLVLVFLCGLTRSYGPVLGPMPAQAGLIASLAVVIGMASPAPLPGALLQAGYFLLGSLWTVLFCVVLWPVPFSQGACLTLASVFGRLADMAGVLRDLDPRPGHDEPGWLDFDTVYRRGVRLSIERGRALAAHDLRTGAILGPGVDAAGRVLSALIAIGHFRRQSGVAIDPAAQSLLDALQRLLSDVAVQAEGGSPFAPALAVQVETLRQRLGRRNDTMARAVSFAATAVGRVARREPRPAPAVPPAGPRLWFFGADPMVRRHALRVAVACGLAYVLGTLLSVTFAYWAAIAAIVVTQPLSANTWLRIVERALGTMVGGTMAAVLLALLSTPGAMVMAILPLAAITVSLRLVNYGLFVIFLTPMFMLLTDFIRPTGGLIVARLANELLGALVGVAASFLFWPEKERDALHAAIRTAISANMAFASAVLRLNCDDTETLDQIQRDAGLASVRLEVARERMLLEGYWRSDQLGRLQPVLVALRSVCGAAAVVEVLRSGMPGEADRQRAAQYDALTASLLAMLDAGEVARQPVEAASLPAGASADELDLALRHLTATMATFTAAAAPARRRSLA
ncbi:putative membrane protein YccC [Cupriavidus agavae]|uniref:Putative membrane protein YccC n=2 Tax=Cupriavidus agavae TaxID=1001822 RepID=A0A4Q7RWQ6_9BURK|nr:putative membrane protein YccC [Cupriavidus agavae]